MLFMLFNLVSWLSPTELVQMLRKGKEKAIEPEPKKKKSRTEKQREREEQATRAMLAQEARQVQGRGACWYLLT
jgi:hypothetical protein